MKHFLKVVLFSLMTIGFFAGFANFGIPKIEPAPPPTAEKLDLGSMTMEQFIAVGDKLYNGKGTCPLCHNSMGRAPMLDKIGSVGPERLSDAQYKGEAKDIESYLYESMVKPSAFVVAGFGKAGTRDTESPMPDVTGGSIGFSEAEIKAVIAYLQNIGGAEVTVTIPTDTAPAEEQQAEQSVTRAPISTAQEIFTHFTCNACHKVEGAGGELGPDLSHIGGQRDVAYIRRSILDPNAEIAEGFVPMMPPIYGDQLYAQELETLVSYLAGLK
jgi:mono/diheme cytochrome c family protein